MEGMMNKILCLRRWGRTDQLLMTSPEHHPWRITITRATG
jgi:hypothetical protein